MKLVSWAVLTLLLSTPSLAWAQQASAAAAAKPATPAKPDKSAPVAKAGAKAGAKPAAKEPAAKDPKAARKPAPDAAARGLARRTKGVFMFAVDTCDSSQSRCDASLRDDAEQRFMEACSACAPFARCEEERDTIRAGKGRSSVDPCAP